MPTRKHVQHIKSSQANKIPRVDDLLYGEIAVNYSDGNEKLFIKNTNNEIVSFVSSKVIEDNEHTTAAALSQLNENLEQIQTELQALESITYANLVTKVNNNELVPGKFYRINDYVTTTTQEDTQSANNVFDVIVLALSTNKLSENAYAVLHSGDTYFSDCNLSAWELKYCLENDTERFAWADATNGKGVIYYMKDEWNNECPYDFKNILFKRYKITSCPKSPDLIDSYGLNGYGITVDTSTPYNVYTFCMLDGSTPNDVSVKQEEYFSDEGFCYHTQNNSIKEYYSEIYFEDTEETKQIMTLPNTVFVTDTDLTFIEENFGSFYAFNANTFGNNSNHSTLGNNCYDNTFGNNSNYNTLGSNCYANTFGNEVSANTFGNDCSYNTFGNGSYANTFGKNSNYNTFGNNSSNNTLGTDCNHNMFGNSSTNNTFGNVCYDNTFGNECSYNTLGNNISNNTFGNGCNHNTFSKPYTKYVIVENGNQYITLTSTQTPANTRPLRNITIAQGVNNTDTAKTISHNTLNNTYRTVYQPINSVTVSV